MECARVMLEMYVCEDILEMSETNEVVVTMRTKKQTWKKKKRKKENQFKEPLPYCHDYGHQIRWNQKKKERTGIRRLLDIEVYAWKPGAPTVAFRTISLAHLIVRLPS